MEREAEREAGATEDELAVGCEWKRCSDYHVKDSRSGGRRCPSKGVAGVYILRKT
jgi:hypothetical protein